MKLTQKQKNLLRKYFKDSNDVKHGNEGREELTKEEIFQSVAGEIKTSEMKLEQRKQMRNTLQHDAREALEKSMWKKKAETKEVQHMTLEGMEKELRENTKHQMEYVNSLKTKYNEFKSIRTSKEVLFTFNGYFLNIKKSNILLRGDEDECKKISFYRNYDMGRNSFSIYDR